ncbi:MAG: family 43 glycosylhydrolase [Cyclobacteriaceae bacterium]
MHQHFLLLLFTLSIYSCSTNEIRHHDWMLTGFVKVDSINPILQPDTSTLFLDPIKSEWVQWEGKDVFNPASLVRNDTLILLYRAEDFVGKYNGTSRIGLAKSIDGLHFEREPLPIFYPDSSKYLNLEWEGGAEDPRIVEDEHGTYYMTYTAYDGKVARLLIASSKDLRTWIKHGSVFEEEDMGKWTKSGAIISEITGEKLVAKKLNDKYWMYFGDTDLFIATSDDLIKWKPVLGNNGEWLKVLSPRAGMFDSRLVEPGPPAMLTDKGVLLIYNSMNLDEGGDPGLPAGTYAAGQALFNKDNPAELIERSDQYFFAPTKDYEITGQVNNVCFVEGLSYYKGKWLLYYGTADSKIAVAVGKGKPEMSD